MKRLAALAFLAGAAGAAVVGIRGRAADDGGGTGPPRVAERPAPTPPPTVPGAPPATPVPRPLEPAAKRRPVLVRVVGASGPEHDVLVRGVARTEPGHGFATLSPPATTDLDGVALLELADPAPPDPLLEMTSSDAEGFRHGFARIDDLRAATAGGPLVARLPEGGTLRVELSGLPPEQRPSAVALEFLPPYGPWLPLFSDVPILPSEDGGVFEVRPAWRQFRVRLGEDGVGTVRHVATDHAVSIAVPATGEGWIVEASSCTGPSEPTREGDLLRVPEGQPCAYTVRFRPAPTVRVALVGKDGGAIAGARVAAGFRHADGLPQLLSQAFVTDVTGVAVVPLWTGTRLPDWVPDKVMVLAWAPDRLAKVVELPGRWYGIDERIELPPAPEGAFVVEGQIRHPDGHPAPGLPLRLATGGPWNGHTVLDPLVATTDGEGRFRLSVPEALRPVFAVLGRVRVALDLDRLESTAVDAFWRSRWPSLPRMAMQPADFPLPPPGGRVQADAQLVAP